MEWAIGVGLIVSGLAVVGAIVFASKMWGKHASLADRTREEVKHVKEVLDRMEGPTPGPNARRRAALRKLRERAED